MALARPLVSVYDAYSPKGEKLESVVMPTVMQSVIRPDLVSFVHYNLMHNKRQAYAVKEGAGYGTSAESWGTGRAVSRIPRVPGGGTHRAGQAAFGNMCRSGGMFAPTKIWRRWHRHINRTQRRHALTSAISGSAIAGLVLGHGHRIEKIPELPLVVSDSIQSIKKTKDAIACLKNLGCEDELTKCKESKKLRAGIGKSRNRRYVSRRGPLLVYYDDLGLVEAFANIPGVSTCHVDRLNLLQVAPGGVIGRFIIWTKSAFERLSALYGDFDTGSQLKTDYILQRPMMTNVDLSRIINSTQIQSQLKQKMEPKRYSSRLKNPLKNRSVRCRLDPAFKIRPELRKKLLKTAL